MLCWVLGFATAVGVVAGTELTFEMGPHEEVRFQPFIAALRFLLPFNFSRAELSFQQCFHELIEESQLVTVEYQVQTLLA